MQRSASSTEKPPKHENRLRDTASAVLQQILRKYEDVTVIISSREGKCLTSTLDKPQAQDYAAGILTFTDKVKVLTRKVLDEELKHVRIRSRTNEIVITFDDELEIITIQEDKAEIGDSGPPCSVTGASSEEN